MPEEPVRSFAYIEEVRLVVVLLDQAHNLMSPSHDEVTTFDYRFRTAELVCALERGTSGEL